MRCVVGVWLAILLLAGAARGADVARAGPVPSRPAADCVPVTVGLDSASWNTSRGTFSGRALGQTFRAVDTVITRITVWRPPNDVDAVGTRLFVTTVDTVRVPGPYPVTQGILQNGPMVFIRDSDPPGQLIRMDFVIDPPLALPHPGIFAFFLQREGCDGGETIIIANDTNPYPHGFYWITGSVAFLPCFLRSVDGGEDNTDLIFEIEFCRDITTPVLPRTWGRLKLIYR